MTFLGIYLGGLLYTMGFLSTMDKEGGAKEALEYVFLCLVWPYTLGVTRPTSPTVIIQHLSEEEGEEEGED